MKFSCERTLLHQAISVTARAVAPKSPIPALEGILVEASEGMLTLTGYDLKTGISTTVPAEVSKPGRMVLSARLFSEIVRKLPEDIISFQADGYNIAIACGMSKYSILGTAAEDFAELPEVDDELSFTMQQAKLRELISQTLFAASTSDNRPVYKGALLDIIGEELTMVCLDGYRLALRRGAVANKKGGMNFSFIVPSAALSEIEKICEDSEDEVKIVQGAKHVCFEVGATRVITRCIEGEFMDYHTAVPRDNAIILKADAKAFMQTVDRVSLIITEKQKSPLRCAWRDGIVTISTKTAIGEASDECYFEGNAGELDIGFNYRYLMDALKVCKADDIKIELNTNVSPMILVPAEGEEDFLYMILPVRLGAAS